MFARVVRVISVLVSIPTSYLSNLVYFCARAACALLRALVLFANGLGDCFVAKKRSY